MKNQADYCKNYIPFNLNGKSNHLVIYQMIQIEEREFKDWRDKANPKEKTIGLRSILNLN